MNAVSVPPSLLCLGDLFSLFTLVSVFSSCSFKLKLFSWQLASEKEILNLNEANGLNKGLIKTDKQNVICTQHCGAKRRPFASQTIQSETPL